MYIKLYLIALPAFFALDFVWLAIVARKFYLSQLGALMKTNINWPIAILFYLIFIVGLIIFVIYPAIEKKSIIFALVMGGLFGFFTYTTYDLTNLATLKNWPLSLSIIDMIWGSILAASVSVITFYIASKLSL
jgi:uncharacterized membrane protein